MFIRALSRHELAVVIRLSVLVWRNLAEAFGKAFVGNEFKCAGG